MMQIEVLALSLGVLTLKRLAVISLLTVLGKPGRLVEGATRIVESSFMRFICGSKLPCVAQCLAMAWNAFLRNTLSSDALLWE